jgi:hypothetical protein
MSDESSRKTPPRAFLKKGRNENRFGPFFMSLDQHARGLRPLDVLDPRDARFGDLQADATT